MRVFVAINLNSKERARLAEAAGGLREAGYPIRWLPAENVHLTLKFLGEVPDERIPELAAAVDGAVHGLEAFPMVVNGFGAFPSPRRPQVVWAGIERNPTLGTLQGRVDEAMAELGFQREDRAFRPHLTLGRAQRRARVADFKGLEELLQGAFYEDTIEVRGVDLMRSRLMPRGALYDILHTARLGS